MKRYVWIAATLIAVTSVEASENPFALKENLQKMESEQLMLLKDLKKEATSLEVIQEEKAENVKEAIQKTSAVKKPEVTEMPAASQESTRPNTEVTTENKEETIVTSKMPENAEPSQEVVQIEKIKDDQAKIDAEREVQAKARAEAKRKATEEKAKQEREALEKLRAEREAAQKRAEEAELARLKEEKEHLENQMKSEASAHKPASQEKKEAGEKDINDINITREALEAKKKADEEMQKAMEEVDQEG
jgi:hypothetical protein